MQTKTKKKTKAGRNSRKSKRHYEKGEVKHVHCLGSSEHSQSVINSHDYTAKNQKKDSWKITKVSDSIRSLATN